MEQEIKNFKIKTAYNRINLHRQGGRLELRSHDNALQSVIDLNCPHKLGLKNLEHLMSVLLFIPEPKSVLMLGTAAGSLLHFLRHYYPRTDITAVDIDVELVEKMLHMEVLPAAGEGLTYVYGDAARFMLSCDQSYDLIWPMFSPERRRPAGCSIENIPTRFIAGSVDMAHSPTTC